MCAGTMGSESKQPAAAEKKIEDGKQKMG